MSRTTLVHNFSTDDFSEFIKTVRDLPWITHREDAIGVICSYCNHEFGPKTLMYLLKSFLVMDDKRLRDSSIWICESIATDPNIDPISHRIIPQDFDGRIGSSNAILERIRIDIAKLPGWSSSNLFTNRMRDATGDDGIKSITLIDDFIGTGSKVDGKLKWIDELRPDLRVSVLSSVALRGGIERNYNHQCFQSIDAHAVIERVFSDALTEPDRSRFLEAYHQMCINHGDILEEFQMGFRGSEAVYGALNWSTPDNTLPIFWLGNRNNQPTVFDRARK